ncbi:MAG: hypothetical protein HYY41_06290 [Chloroflexi bacterium]|nr:hypothetical protein [Chloroflexota bacterium]MBI2980413.1 hypothetical protein [Chloroflexota bacterium]
MSDKRILIVDAEVIRKIEENRGDMSRSDFINFLINNSLKEEDSVKPEYITKEEFDDFQQGTRELLRNFLEFFISYGLELGKQPEDETFEELTQKLKSFGSHANNKEKKA